MMNIRRTRMHKRIPNLIQPFLSNGTVLPQLPLSNGWLAPSKLLTNEVCCCPLPESVRPSECLLEVDAVDGEAIDGGGDGK